MRANSAVAILLLGTQVPFVQAKKPVTLETVSQWQAAGTPVTVVWAPDGKRFAWKAGKSVWLYDVASHSRRELVSLDALAAAATRGAHPEASEWQNRNVKEQDFQWFPAGDRLLIAAGGDLFVFRIAAGGWTQLTTTGVEERDPRLSPDGRSVSFRRGNDLYSMDVARKMATRLTFDGSDTLWNGRLDWVYAEELEIPTAHWWSPDSRQIAYFQFDVSRQPLYPHADILRLRPVYEPQRYPKAGDPNADVRLGVVPAGGGRTRWLDVGETRDALLARVAWVPDNRALFVQRLNRIQNRLDLLRADAASGTASLILREEDRYWINVHDHLRFLKNGAEFLWSSESDGFRHLYRYSADGRLLAQLTRGDWEVTELSCVEEAGGQAYFVSTERSPLERHLYRAGLSGEDRRRVSVAAGTHEVSMAPSCEHYLDAFSNLSAPLRQALHGRDGVERAVFQDVDRPRLEEYEVPPTEIVEVKAAGGALLYGRLIKPAGFQPGRKYPAIVIVYGGPHAQAVRNHWPGVKWEHAMAHQGFVIWQLDNRGSAGRGHEWESVIFRKLGEKELEDQKEGVRHLISMGFVDSSRLGIYGWSYGGYMTLLALLKAPDLFRAGAAGAPLADWRNYDTIYTERYMGLPSDNPEGYRSSSPVHFASALKAKLLLIHAYEDDNVLFQNSMQMADALQRAGKPFEWMIYPAKAHTLSGNSQKHMLETLAAFFERSLKD